MTHLLTIRGEDCTVAVLQRAETVWEASGTIEGRWISGKARSERTALSA